MAGEWRERPTLCEAKGHRVIDLLRVEAPRAGGAGVRPEPEIHAPIEVIRGDVLVRMPAQVNTAVLRQIIEAVRGC